MRELSRACDHSESERGSFVRLSPRIDYLAGVTSGEENAEMFDEEILTWMIVQVSREDREAIARWACTRAVSRQCSNVCGREQIFLCHSSLLFFLYRHSSRTDRTLTLWELSVLEDRRTKICATHSCT